MNGPLLALDPADKSIAIPGTFGAVIPTRLLPEAHNYAEHEATRQFARDLVYPMLDMMRNDKAPLHEEWNAIRRMEMLQHDEGRKYMGRSDVYIPLWQRASTTLISQICTGLFPSDEYMDVSSRNPSDPAERAKSVKAYMQWEFESNGQVRRQTKPFAKQFVAYGNGCWKFLYRQNKVYQGRRVRFGNMMGSAFKPQQRKEGLHVSPRSVFNMYVYPYTASCIEECSIVAEDILISRRELEFHVKNGAYLNGEAALAQSNAPTQMEADIQEQLLTRDGLPGPGHGAHTELAQQVGLTEVWTFMKLPASAYVTGEDSRCDIPVRILFAGDVPVVITRNPYWHQQAPYLIGRQNLEAGSFWGYGAGRSIRYLQYLANDYANQSNDAGIYSLNPMALVNTALVAGPMPKVRPGATIPVTDVREAVSFIHPPIQVAQEGYAYMQLISSMAMDFAGTPPILQGAGASKAAKTATGAAILQKNSMAPLQDVVEDLELDVMVPLLYGAWINAQQYRNEEIMAVVGGQPIKITPEELAIDAEFRWLGSNQAMNSQMRSQQAIQLIQAVMPLVPLMNSQGYIVDFKPIIQKVFNDGMGFRGFDEFIHKMTPQEQMAAMAQMGGVMGAQNPGAPQAEQGSRLRSALDQVTGEPQEMAPGEGEDFAAVRQQVEEETAQMGVASGNPYGNE
jgi:hypothetical protein